MGKKLKQLKYISKATTLVIKEKAKEKLKQAREDKRYPALILLEAILSVMLAISIVVYWSRERPELYKLLNFFHKYGFMQNTPDYWIDKIPGPPLSYLFFIIWIGIIFWFYSYTASFRQDYLGKSLLLRFLKKIRYLNRLRILPLKEVFPKKQSTRKTLKKKKRQRTKKRTTKSKTRKRK